VVRAGGLDDARMVTKFYGHLAQEHIDQVVSEQKVTPNSHPGTQKSSNAGGKAA
jgi:hypothetical protein